MVCRIHIYKIMGPNPTQETQNNNTAVSFAVSHAHKISQDRKKEPVLEKHGKASLHSNCLANGAPYKCPGSTLERRSTIIDPFPTVALGLLWNGFLYMSIYTFSCTWTRGESKWKQTESRMKANAMNSKGGHYIKAPQDLARKELVTTNLTL